MEDNPSVRFYCPCKETLDNFLKKVEEARNSKSMEALKITLENYIECRARMKCEGCKRGMISCVHWSPEKIEIPWS